MMFTPKEIVTMQQKVCRANFPVIEDAFKTLLTLYYNPETKIAKFSFGSWIFDYTVFSSQEIEAWLEENRASIEKHWTILKAKSRRFFNDMKLVLKAKE